MNSTEILVRISRLEEAISNSIDTLLTHPSLYGCIKYKINCYYEDIVYWKCILRDYNEYQEDTE